jgi:y4mF family transcriptional regulator
MINERYVYIAKNPLMVGFCKIGCSRDSEKRMKSLYGEWKLHKEWEVEDGFKIETRVKELMRPLRAHGHELFNCPLSYLENIVEQVIYENYESIFEDEKVKEIPLESLILRGNTETVGKIIKEVRKKQGMTQSELAGACGVGPRLIVDIEKGKPTCQMGKVLYIFRMLGIQVYFKN